MGLFRRRTCACEGRLDTKGRSSGRSSQKSGEGRQSKRSSSSRVRRGQHDSRSGSHLPPLATTFSACHTP